MPRAGACGQTQNLDGGPTPVTGVGGTPEGRVDTQQVQPMGGLAQEPAAQGGRQG